MFSEIFDTKKYIEKKEPGDFYGRLMETEMFSTFVETQVLGGPNASEIKQFGELTKNSSPVITPPNPSETFKAPLPSNKGIRSTVFSYPEFPILSSKYITRSTKEEKTGEVLGYLKVRTKTRR